MGQHHRREDPTVTVAAPTGRGYPPPTSYRPHPVTGVPTPPPVVHLAEPDSPAPDSPEPDSPVSENPAPQSPADTRLRHRAPLAVAVVGIAVAVVGGAAQLPSLTAGVLASGTPAGGGGTPSSEDQGAGTARRCATIVADALDTTVADLGRITAPRWASVVEGRGSTLAATYGVGSPEYRAYAEGVDDIVGWMRDDTTTEDYGAVTIRVAQGVAATCGDTG